MRRSLPALLAVSSLLVLGLSSPASANHSWGTYHWARTSPGLTIGVGDNVDASWDAYYKAANTDWSKAAALDVTQLAGSSTGRKCRPVSGRVEACNAAYGNTGWLGLASISLSGGHITSGTAKVNDTYFTQTTYNTPAQRLDVMCQEIGHTFGLDHPSTDGSNQLTCMDYSNDSGATNQPNAHDFEQLSSMYSHSDRTSTVTASAAATRAQAGNDRASWGREVSRSKDGRSSTFVRDLGDGEQVVTFVDWVAPQR